MKVKAFHFSLTTQSKNLAVSKFVTSPTQPDLLIPVGLS